MTRTQQAGIFFDATQHHRHLEFDVDDDVTNDEVRAALRDIRTVLASAHGVIGFGDQLWKRLKPVGDDLVLTPFTPIGRAPATQHDVWVWLHEDSDGALFDAALAVTHSLAGVGTLAAEVHGFVYRDNRDLTGFIDGTENPDHVKAPAVASIAPGAPGAGGSFALVQRWIHDLESFGALPVPRQELVIGRTKSDSIELDDSVRPATAHISRVVIDDSDGSELEIYRRSVPYGSVAEHGLQFIAFSAELSRFDKMLRNMFGESGDGLHDRLTEFSRPVTGSYYFVPSNETLSVIG